MDELERKKLIKYMWDTGFLIQSKEMKDKSRAFKQWIEYYFENTQEKDIPYEYYEDIQIAFFTGWEKHKETIQNKNDKI